MTPMSPSGDQCGTSYITLPSRLNHPSNCTWRYYVDGKRVYCVEPTVIFTSKIDYDGTGEYYGAHSKEMSYVYEKNVGTGNTDADEQIKQAVIWAYTGYFKIDEISGTYAQKAKDLYNEAINHVNATEGSLGNPIGASQLDFTYDGAYWVSQWITINQPAYSNSMSVTASGGNGDWGVQQSGNQFRVVQRGSDINGQLTLQLNVQVGKTKYRNATVYTDINSQNQEVVASGGSYPENENYSISGTINPLGNLIIEKKDTYHKFKEGARFKVEGPSGVFDNVRTGADGVARLDNLLMGNYTITELDAPAGMINEETNRTVTVTVNPSATATFTRYNGYPRGSATLSKYDKDNPGNTKGDATLAGAIYNLYAAETIKEGEETIYTANQIVKENIVTDEYGNTEVITNLPVGNYYYKEIKPSEGFNINPDRVDFTIKYIDQNTPVIPTVENVAPEPPIYGNIKIVKKLEATDYDPQKLLKDVQFKATYVDKSGIKHEDQVYYSNVSGEDGICEINHIPYGTYEIEEIKYPKEARKVENFKVEVKENNKTIEIEKEDPIVDMRIEVYKEVVVEEGEATDAKAEGAYFTVYRDQGCAEDSKVCVIGPTDENGYAISGTMVRGTYYLKETEFPEGIDENAIIPGENVTYKDKVYTVTYEDTSEGTEPAKIGIKIINVPIRNSIEMIKTVGETTSSKKSPLKGAEFTATLISSIGTDHEFSRKCTAPTDENGYCIIEDLPYGEYIIEETTVPDITLKCSDFKLFVKQTEKDLRRKYQMTDVEFVDPKNTLDDVVKDWLDQNGYLEDEPKTMKIKIKKVDANREETDEPDMTQGDATLEGAIYQLYKYNEEKGDYSTHVYDITVDHKDEDGYWCAETGDLLVGKYMIKEKIKYTEIKDGVTYNYSYAEGYLADPKEYYFEQVPGEQEVKRTYHEDISREEVIRGRVEVIKQNNIPGQTEEVASAGAILRLVLKSNRDIYYQVTINENGYGEFVEEKSREKYYPYTIPYGDYELIEIAESNPEEHTHWFTQPEDIKVEKQMQKEYRIESDEPVPMYLQVIKKDLEDNTTVALEGAGFKIWSINDGGFVSLYDTQQDKKIDTFYTGKNGYFITPEKLYAGEYIVYEVEAPEGYVLNEEWKMPTKEDGKTIDEERLGVVGEGGKHLEINKISLGIANDEEYPGLDAGDLIYKVEMPDKRAKGKVEIYKVGEMLTDIKIVEGEYGIEKRPVVYKTRIKRNNI